MTSRGTSWRCRPASGECNAPPPCPRPRLCPAAFKLDAPPWPAYKPDAARPPRARRSFEMGPGCVVGCTDFYLTRPHRTEAAAASAQCRVLCVTRAAVARLALEAPHALNVLQLCLMRANTFDLITAAALGQQEV